MKKSTNVLAAGLCLLFITAMPARADIVAESLHAFGTIIPNYVGQSFTTGPAAQYSNLSFNFYTSPTNPTSNAYASANQTYLLLDQEYLGTNAALSAATTGFIAATTGVSGNQWVFDPSVTLNGSTQYWLYGTGNLMAAQSYAVGSTYLGGRMYQAIPGGPGNTFQLAPANDLAFTINSNPVPEAVSIVDVTYDSPVINSGPLSFGLSELPVAPNATFTVGGGVPTGGGATGYGLSDVVSANFIFGDGFFTTLSAFDLEVNAGGSIESLSYSFASLDTPTVQGPVVLNFPLSITGTDIASGQTFSYTYANSTGTITPVPITGDLNGDGFVGVDDLNIVLINWNQNVTPGGLTQGDPTGEGFVGVDDLNIVLVNWNNGTPPPVEASDVVPEPGAISILFIGSLILSRLRLS